MARKLIVLFDGTWNNKKSRTNVIRMREAIASSGPDGLRRRGLDQDQAREHRGRAEVVRRRARERRWGLRQASARCPAESPAAVDSGQGRGDRARAALQGRGRNAGLPRRGRRFVQGVHARGLQDLQEKVLASVRQGRQRIGPRERVAALEGEARVSPGVAAPASGQARRLARDRVRAKAWSRTRNRTWISHKLSARLDLRSPVIAPSSVARGG